MRETDRRYLKMKMKKIKESKEKENHTQARRHATELLQYFGIGDSDVPLETLMAELEMPMPFREKVRTFK